MHAGARRQVVIALATVMAVLGVVGFILWRTLPPVVSLPTSHAHAGAPPYSPPTDLPSVLPVPDATGITYALVREPENVQVHGPGLYGRELDTWAEWLSSMGAVEVDAVSADVLVLPTAQCLGAASRQLLARHLAEGGGAVVSGAIGAYDGSCQATGDTVLVSLLGGGDIIAPYADALNESFHAVLHGESVLGAGVPPGARIALTQADQIAFRGEGRELYYADYDRNPQPFRGTPHFDGGVARSMVGAGRVVAIGFRMETLSDEWSRRIARLMVANAMRWAAGQMVYQLASWPDGLRAAAVLAQDVEADYHNARNTVGILDVPATAFIVGRLAEADPVTTSQILEHREVATHTYSHLPLDTMSYAAQTRELAQSKQVTERLANRPVRGLRPPEERFNVETLQIWADLGGEYVFGASDMRLAAPEIVPVLPDSIVLLARVTADDFEILSSSGMRDLGEISRSLAADIRRVVSVGGLFMFSYHSHMFAQKPLVPLVRGLGEHLDAQPEVWKATAGEVAGWWRRRSYVDVQRVGGTARVLNRGDAPFSQGVLLLDAPDGRRVRVELPVLQPGSAVTVGEDGVVR